MSKGGGSQPPFGSDFGDREGPSDVATAGDLGVREASEAWRRVCMEERHVRWLLTCDASQGET
ncbi:hypothetical protein ES332_A09G130100v1 [Gossypium tomentosum]|uniref:Uncharacterized protein n=1 Tax=Gossypium tomentosum TaxID=34277 RepID=A0A5D2P2D7_GOSTO|nr:hypothetical protein ES332_A09G130100v1 [Gossypium tomentosum]